jgi:hypothetical protein
VFHVSNGASHIEHSKLFTCRAGGHGLGTVINCSASAVSCYSFMRRFYLRVKRGEATLLWSSPCTSPLIIMSVR